MKINGFEYSKQEVQDALRAKGYLILNWTWNTTDETFPGGTEHLSIDTQCALKGTDLCSEATMWENVAIREFQKEFIKPKLV